MGPKSPARHSREVYPLKMRALVAILAVFLVAAGAGYSKVKFELKSKTGYVVITGEYPQVNGDPKWTRPINDKLKAFVVNFRNPDKFEAEDPEFYKGNHYTEEVTCDVTLLDKNYISAQIFRMGMLQQAAHPSNEFAGITINLANGKVMTIKDFLKPNSEKKLFEKIAARSLKEAPDMPIDDHKVWDFVLTKDGVRFINLVEGHAVSSYTVDLTWKELADIKK